MVIKSDGMSGFLPFLLNHRFYSFVISILVQSVNQELQEVRLQLRTEQDKVVDLEKELRELKVRG